MHPQSKHRAAHGEQLKFPHLDPLCNSLPSPLLIMRRLSRNIPAPCFLYCWRCPLLREGIWDITALRNETSLDLETTQPLKGTVCFYGPFTTVKLLEESQTMKEYGKISINQVKSIDIKLGRHLPFIVSSDRLNI